MPEAVSRTRGRPARRPSWRRRVLVFVGAVLVLLPLAGLIYEAWADGMAAREFPSPGILVDIGGRRLHLLCIGSGEPTVFFEPGGFQTAISSSRARETLATRTRVCSYDRAGMGWSDPGPDEMSTADLARDLAVLQDRARLRGPYVIVATSIGGLTAELFARQFPERVAGLVLLDAANSVLLPHSPLIEPWVRRTACGAGFIAHFGVFRLIDPFDFRRERTDAARRGAALAYNSRPWVQLCSMGRGMRRSLDEFKGAGPLRADLPLTVLSASSVVDLMPPGIARFVDVGTISARLQESHRQLAKQTSRGKWQLVPNSTHLIATSQPDVVVAAVSEMLDQVR